MQLGDLDEAAIALQNSVRIAGESADTEAEAESYEVALTVDAVARLSELRRQDGAGARDRSEAIFGRLGIVARPTVQVPANAT